VSPGPDRIVHVGVAVINAGLRNPVTLGQYSFSHREYVVVRLTSKNGFEGWASCMSRNGTVAEQFRKSILPAYLNQTIGDPALLFDTVIRANPITHSTGIGLRALSLADLAYWDLVARIARLPIAEYLGGRNQPMPAAAIVGYPPAMPADEVRNEVAALSARGWTRFKTPIGMSESQTAERVRAARSAAPGSWLALDAAWTYDDVSRAARFAKSIEDVRLAWLEDVFPPGDVNKVKELRSRIDTPIAVGDDQGGWYYPDALLDAGAVDVVRVDLTCMGGITGGQRILSRIIEAGAGFSTHIFPRVHGQVLAGLGYTDVPLEVGAGMGELDPYEDSLGRLDISHDGRIAPFTEGEAGFGYLCNRRWALQQSHSDPDGILQPS
jgi:L-alanine-DL-glutamate epimerase-like enolase superfamily enzyme